MLRRHLDARHVLVRARAAASPPPVETCSTCTRLPAAVASLSSFAVAASAASGSRHSLWLEGSPSRLSDARSRKRASSSAWKAARRSMRARMRGKRLLVVDQKVAGRGAHEDLDAGGARKLLQPRQAPRHSRAWRRRRRRSRNTCARARVRPCAASASALTVAGLVFGISNTAVTPPSTADRLPDLEVFLVLEPRLAEMHLGVDDAWQDMQAGGLERPRRRFGQRWRRSRRFGRLSRRYRQALRLTG